MTTVAAAEPSTGLTTWERWRAGYKARSDEERRHYRELDAALSRPAADRPARLRDAAEAGRRLR